MKELDKNLQRNKPQRKKIGKVAKGVGFLLAGIIAYNGSSANNINNPQPKNLDNDMYRSEYVEQAQTTSDKTNGAVFDTKLNLNDNLNKDTGEKPPEEKELLDGPLKYYKNLSEIKNYTPQLGINEQLVNKINSNLETRNRKDMFIANATLARAFEKFKTNKKTITRAFLGIYSKTLGLTDKEIMLIMGEDRIVREVSGKLTQVLNVVIELFNTDPEIKEQFKKNGENIQFNNMLEGISKEMVTTD